MKRRDFLRAAAGAGLAVASPVVLAGDGLSTGTRRDHFEPYGGLFFVNVNADGGWDPTSFCDPKGTNNPMDPDRMNNYLKSQIEQAGNISYASIAGAGPFFQKYYNRLLVINGMDMQTNSHDGGNRHQWSGRLGEGYPSLSAFMAGAMSPEAPMSYLSFGGYDITAGIVARTRAGNTQALGRLAYPERINPDDGENLFHSPAALSHIRQSHLGREQALLATQGLPRIRQAMSTLFTARVGSNELKLLQQYLPDDLDNSDNRLIRQAQVAVAAYRAGICVSATLNEGGFDTHGNHDEQHLPRLQNIWEGVDALVLEAERQGVADKLVVVMGSDFGRTPGYNEGNGKDHWSVSSMMMMGPGIPGNRVIGQTTDRHDLVPLDPNSLQPSGEGGIQIEPGHVHRALRGLAGLGESELAAMFPIDLPDLPLFA